MREGIHPNYIEATVVCACGNTFKTRSTKPSIRLEICSNCHPFFSGKQKFVDSAGRVERFQKRFAKAPGETVKKPVPAKMAKGQVAALSKKKIKILSSAPIVIPKKESGPRSGGSKSLPASRQAPPKPAAPKAAH
jgi:large subunit ribosomal protein L31